MTLNPLTSLELHFNVFNDPDSLQSLVAGVRSFRASKMIEAVRCPGILSHLVVLPFRAQLYSKKTFEDTPYVATRIQSWCLYWLAAMVVGACHNVVLDYNGPISFLELSL